MKKLFGWAAGLTLTGALAATPVLSQTQTENIVAEQRTSVSLRVAPEAAQAFLPAGWVLNASGAGPNLTLIFMDRTLQLTPDGKPLQSGANRLLVLSVPARNTASGETRGLIVGEFSTDPLGVPGAYKVYRPGTITVHRTEKGDAKDGKITTEVEERWLAKGADGSTVNLDLKFTRGLPANAAFDMKVYSGADPTFYRMYKGQQSTDTLRNATVNRVQSVSLKASGGRLGRAIDGTQQIVSISQAPSYSRRTFVP